MRIGYGKFARSWGLDPSDPSTVGGDIDVIRLLKRLAGERPDDEFFLIGRCQKIDPGSLGYPDNVVNPWDSAGWALPTVSADSVADNQEAYFEAQKKFRVLTKDLHLDALVLWLGQVANANSPIPPSGEDWGPNTKLTSPQVMAANYTLYLVDLCNRTGIEPILLCPDPRNYWKPRELTRPLRKPILAQYQQVRGTRHEQYQEWEMPWQAGYTREGSQIVATAVYEYAAVELTALEEPASISFSDDPDRPHDMGLVTNENAFAVPEDTSRLRQIQKYILAQWPGAPIWGKWTDASMKVLGRNIEPVPYAQVYDTLRSFCASMTFPASGSGWATAKPWEAFAVGTPMFFHHRYDDQGWIVPRSGSEWRELRKFLIVHNQRQLWERTQKLRDDRGLFQSITRQQRELFEQRFMQWKGGSRAVLERLKEITI